MGRDQLSRRPSDDEGDDARAKPGSEAGEWAVPGLGSGRGPLPNAGARLVDETARLAEQFAERARSVELAEQLVQARSLIDQLESVWLLAAADFEASGGVTASGSGSLMSWMRHHCKLAPGEASARARVAHAVAGGELRQTGEAMIDGEINWRQAHVIHHAVRQVPEEHHDDAESALLEAAHSLDPGQLRRVGERLLHCFDRDAAEEAAVRRYEQRGFTMAETFDGLFSVSGMLDPITGALLMTALDTKMRPPCGAGSDGDDGSAVAGEPTAGIGVQSASDLRTWAQRRADALGEICAEWLEGSNQTTVGGVRPHLSVIVDVSTLRAESGAPAQPGELGWSGPITAAESQLLGCDATVSRILMDGPSMVLDVGRATRTIPPAIRRAVVARDRTCVAPGCHRPPEHCDVHHVRFWEQGGDTSLENTVLVCRRHHRMIHQHGFRVVVDSTGRRSIEPP
ncbi:MAG: DUF222 domain-containing protein [Actinomycetes bacterium]